jgi:hypothetical protein
MWWELTLYLVLCVISITIIVTAILASVRAARSIGVHHPISERVNIDVIILGTETGTIARCEENVREKIQFINQIYRINDETRIPDIFPVLSRFFLIINSNTLITSQQLTHEDLFAADGVAFVMTEGTQNKKDWVIGYLGIQTTTFRIRKSIQTPILVDKHIAETNGITDDFLYGYPNFVIASGLAVETSHLTFMNIDCGNIDPKTLKLRTFVIVNDASLHNIIDTKIKNIVY